MTEDTASKTDLDYLDHVINVINNEQEQDKMEDNNNHPDNNIENAGVIGSGVDTAITGDEPAPTYTKHTSQQSGSLRIPNKPEFVRSSSDAFS